MSAASLAAGYWLGGGITAGPIEGAAGIAGTGPTAEGNAGMASVG